MFYNPFKELLIDLDKNNMLEKPLLEQVSIDLVNEPEHYGSTCNMEAIDVIELFSLNFNLGNVIKYVLRCERKGNKTQDLQKAIWYLNREIDKFNG